MSNNAIRMAAGTALAAIAIGFAPVGLAHADEGTAPSPSVSTSQEAPSHEHGGYLGKLFKNTKKLVRDIVKGNYEPPKPPHEPTKKPRPTWLNDQGAQTLKQLMGDKYPYTS